MKNRSLVEQATIYAKAINEPNRMKMLKILGSAPPDTVSVGDIAKKLDISQPAVSKHLQILSLCGMLKRKKIGNCVYYSLDPEAVDDFQKVATAAFKAAWTPCNYGYKCEECPYKESCI